MMKGKEYKKMLKTLKLSQAKAAAFLGISPRQSRRLAGDHADITMAQEKLLRLMVHLAITPQIVNDICKIKPVASSKKKTTEDAVA